MTATNNYRSPIKTLMVGIATDDEASVISGSRQLRALQDQDGENFVGYAMKCVVDLLEEMRVKDLAIRRQYFEPVLQIDEGTQQRIVPEHVVRNGIFPYIMQAMATPIG